jgi:hypothetical protein
MAIALTSDPIVAIEDVKAVLNLNDETTAKLLINSVSEKFLRYTERTVLNSTSVIETLRGDGTGVIWLLNYASAIASVIILANGDASITYDSDDFSFDTVGRISLHSVTTPLSYDEENVKVTYTGGWATIPGDIVLAALEQMQVENNRLSGRGAGISSESFEGHSVSYEQDGIVSSVKDVWRKYKVLR